VGTPGITRRRLSFFAAWRHANHGSRTVGQACYAGRGSTSRLRPVSRPREPLPATGSVPLRCKVMAAASLSPHPPASAISTSHAGASRARHRPP
jgi:hypothetical protein